CGLGRWGGRWPGPTWPGRSGSTVTAWSASSAVPPRSSPRRTRSMPVSPVAGSVSRAKTVSLPMATRRSLTPCSRPHSQYGCEPTIAWVSRACGSSRYWQRTVEPAAWCAAGSWTMRWHSRGGRSLFFANSVTPPLVAGARATIVSQPMKRASRPSDVEVKRAALLSSSGTLPAILPRPCALRSRSPERLRDSTPGARRLGGGDLRDLLARLPPGIVVIDLILLLAVLAASAAAGLLALRAAGALPSEPREHLLAGLATGLGLASIVGLALAAAGVLRPVPLAIAGAIALVAGGRSLIAALRAVRAPRGPMTWLLVALCAVLL